MEKIYTIFHWFADKQDFKKSQIPPLSLIEFDENTFENLSPGCFSVFSIKNCFLLQITICNIHTEEEYLVEEHYLTRYYLIEPVYEVQYNRRYKYLRISLVESVQDFTSILEYLRFLVLNIKDEKEKELDWLKIMETVILHFIDLEKSTNKKEKIFDYKKGQYKDIINNKLKNQKYDEKIIEEVISNLDKYLTNDELYRPYEAEEEYGYSSDEWDQMYRDAYENDPNNQWNND